MKIKYLLYFIVTMLLLTITVSISSSLIMAYFNANEDWVSATIGFGGNIIGGILGGYIAYFVARYQIEEGRKAQEAEGVKDLKNVAFMLKEEIKNNSLTLDSIITSGSIDGAMLKVDLYRETWLLFASKIASKLDETLYISLNTIYRKIQIYQSMSIDEINTDVTLENIQRLKYQLDDSIRKLDDFINRSN
jgi:hypothetical protein